MAQKLKSYLESLGGWDTLDARAQKFMERVDESWDGPIIEAIEKTLAGGTEDLDLASIISKVLDGASPFVAVGAKKNEPEQVSAETAKDASSDTPQTEAPLKTEEKVVANDEKAAAQSKAKAEVSEKKQPKQKSAKSGERFSGIRNMLGGIGEKARGMFSGSSGDDSGAPKNVIVYIIAVMAAIGFGIYTYLNGGLPEFGGTGISLPTIPTPEGVRFDGPAAVNFVLRFTELAVFATIFISLLESMDRHDPLLLDWWWPLVTWGVMIYAGKNGITTTTAFFMGGAIFTLVLGALWSLQELQDSVWDRFDTSGIFCFCFYMILTYHSGWTSVPYPAFVPVGVFYAIGALALIKELIRTSQMFLLGIAVAFLGAAAGFFLTFSWVIVSFGLTIAAVYIGAHQEWLPIKGRRTELEKEFAKRLSIRLIKAWDVMFVWWASFILTILVVYGNFPVMYLAR